MFRWIFVCLLLSAGAVAAVWAVAPKSIPDQTPVEKVAPDQKNPEAARPVPAVASAAPLPAVVSGPKSIELIHYGLLKQSTAGEPILIPNGTLVIPGVQEVTSAKEGTILFIGTDVLPDEVVPPEKQLPRAELGFLVVQMAPNEKLREGEKAFPLYENDPTRLYRRVREGEELEPNKITLAREWRPVRKLQVGYKVKRDQLVGLVNPRKSFDEVASRVAKLAGADADRAASRSQKDEYWRRHQTQKESNRLQPGSVSKDDYQATLLQYAKFAAEEKVKVAAITTAQRELNAALTDLKMHEIRAAIDGTIKVIYKN